MFGDGKGGQEAVVLGRDHCSLRGTTTKFSSACRGCLHTLRPVLPHRQDARIAVVQRPAPPRFGEA